VKQGNEYASLLGAAYEETPKAVLAAIAISYAMRDGDESYELALERLLEEWRILHANGIIPQAPHAAERALARVARMAP
jgi:hypothetical protein